jgi:protein-S-isoprenylcysteine O-methyltransferase Ste14
MVDSSLYNTRIEKLRRPVSTIFVVVLGLGLLFTKPLEFGTGFYQFMELVGYLLIFSAVLGRMWCILYIGGRKNRELCRVGPYASCRNPLYFFSFLGVIGIFLAGRGVILTGLACVGFLIYYKLVIRMEETRLEAIFGDDFTAYCSDVPRFWPRWPEPLVAHRFEVDGRAFTRALTEVFWFLFAIILVECLEILKGHTWWPDVTLPF